MNCTETVGMTESVHGQEILKKLYGQEQLLKQTKRYIGVIEKYRDNFGEDKILLFSSPGRTEISGNHTDHNHGKVLAGSIDMDCVCAAGKNNSTYVHVISETFEQNIIVDLNHLEPGENSQGTEELLKGILTGFREAGYETGGFNAYVTSDVISSAGVSSSAAFEMLMCAVLNRFFNDGKMSVTAYAHMGKYAENKYWNKASGLLDQMACAVGGLVFMDFFRPEEPEVKKLEVDFSACGYELVIVQTGRGHADLSEDYSSIPMEMKKVAEFFHKDVCAEICEEDVLENLEKVRRYAGDRAVLRALHFFEENKRVDAETDALREGKTETFLSMINASGNSSWKWLQNCYTIKDCQSQGISIALALTELFIARIGDGACRIHGGGFAGVILAVLPVSSVKEYISYMNKDMGEGNVYPVKIRRYGAVCVNDL